MRYYHYGAEQHTNLLTGSGMPASAGSDTLQTEDRDLIIEDDTIYEIDRECLNCRRGRLSTGRMSRMF